jgi:uncharacterized repeat protein (TIGR03803 family)
MAGTIFRLALDGSEIQLLETFGNGVEPEGGLIRGSDGRLYGTTVAGFTCSFGVVFRMDADGGAYTRLHTFNGTDGMEPFGNLTQGPDGTLYGTTGNAGDSACGNVFQISPDGSGFSSLYTFTGADGCHPRAGLVRTPEGDFFGTTVEGGGSALGTVFRLYKDGENWSVDTLHSFDGPNGANPLSALTIGTDGYLYGTTFSGGGGYGTVFRISTGGAFTSLYSLGSSDGHHPRGRLTEGEAGWFYGTASDGGPYGSGTLFKIYKDGTGITTLHGFNYDDGVQPIGGLVRDASGNFYGTTNEGSDVGYGTVFMLDADETTFTTLHSFAGRPDDGEYPAADLLLADGTLYGTTEYGGTGEGGWGTVFRVQPGVSAPHVSISAGGPTTVCEGESVLLTATPSGGSGTYPGYQWYGGGYPIGGATSATYSAEDSGEYSATVTDSSFDTSVKSESVAVTIRPLPAATINPNGTRVICAGSSVDLTASAGSSWLWSTGATTPSITVDTPGDYTVTVTDANGCSATSEPTTVTSVSAPAAIVSGGGTICTRGSATIQAALSGGTPPWSIRWSDGVEQLNIASSPATRTVTPRATTTYTLTAVWDGYCDSGTLDGSAMVAVADRPKAVLKGSAAICPGGSATLTVELTGTGPWNLTWSDGWPQTGITSSPAVRIVSPSVDTIYSISTVSDAGCSPGSARGSARIKIDSIPSASITAPSSVCASSTGNAASVPNAKGGATYAWTVDNGTITSGQGSRNIQFTAGPSGSVVLHVTVSNSGGCSTTSDLTVAIDTGC